MSAVKGKDAILYWQVNGVYKPICCMETCSLVTNTELKETSTKNTGTSRTFRGFRNTWSVSCAGVVSFDTNWAVSVMRDLQTTFTEIVISFSATDDNGLTENYTGNVLITAISTDAAANDFFNYSVEATGTSEYIVSETPVDPNVNCLEKWVYYNGVGGEFQFTDTRLIGSEVAGRIYRDGVEYRPSGINHDGSGTPMGKQFSFDAGAGTIHFDSITLPALQFGEAIDVPYTDCEIGSGSGSGAASCAGVAIPDGTVLPNQIIGTPYSYSFTLEGDSPFTMEIISAPAWMGISLNGTTGVVTFSGTPVTGQTAIVTIDFMNCGGVNTDTLNDDVSGGVPIHAVYKTVYNTGCQSQIQATVYATRGNSVTVNPMVEVSGNLVGYVVTFPWNGALPDTNNYGAPFKVTATLDNGSGQNSVATMIIRDETFGANLQLTFARYNSGDPC